MYLPNLTSVALQIRQVHLQGPTEQKPIKNFPEKGPWAYPGTPQFLRVPPIISGAGKATDFRFGRYIDRVYANKSPLKTSGTVAICIFRQSCTFSGHPYIGRIARLSLRQHGFLVLYLIAIRKNI